MAPQSVLKSRAFPDVLQDLVDVCTERNEDDDAHGTAAVWADQREHLVTDNTADIRGLTLFPASRSTDLPGSGMSDTFY